MVNLDVSKPVSGDIRHPAATRLDDFDPDRRIDARRNAPSSSEVFDPDKRVEGLYTSRADRIKCAGYTDGEWDGDVGDSRVRPNLENILGRAAFTKLQEFGMSDVSYTDGVVDFSECAVESVEIDGMTKHRDINRGKALAAVAEKWNSAGSFQHDGKKWTADAVGKWATSNGLRFHECSDMKTCQFVPKEIHNYFKHYGGIAECKARDALIGGGGFDA